jgi:molybdopterin biosynthesis enzyme
MAQALVESWPGENVRRAGDDVPGGAVLVQQGQKITAIDALIAARTGLATLPVRQPHVAIVGAGDAIAAMIASFARRCGASVAQGGGSDLVIAMGESPADAEWVMHGLALEPGRDIAIGRLGATPMILFPRQPDQAFAGCLALARPAIDRLTALAQQALVALPLAAKISSRVGVAELVLLRAQGGFFHPLASGDAPLQALGRATHAALIAGESEGHAAGEMFAAQDVSRP